MQPSPTCDAPGQEKAEVDAWWTPWRLGSLLALFLTATFPGVVVGQRAFFFRDFGTLAYPCVHYQRECFWRGELPLWNPLIHCGVPFLAQWNTLTLYPGSLIYLLLPLPWSLNLFGLVHLLLGGLAMYFLAFRWVGNRLASTVAGVAYVGSGAVLSCHIYPNYLVALAWLPAVVLLAERAGATGGRQVLLAALAAAMQLLSGAPELIAQTWLVILASSLLRSGQTRCVPTVGPASSRPRILGRLGLVLILALGLTAAQWLPFQNLLTHSQRGPGYSSVPWSMPVWGWANLLVPLFRCYRTPQGVFFPQGQSFLASFYLGIGVVALAAIAVWRVRCRRVWLLAGLALLGMVLAMGDHGGLFPWLERGFPPANLMRYPIKFVYLAAFASPLLAAYGVAWLRASAGRLRVLQVRTTLLVVAGLSVVAAGIVVFALHRPLRTDDWPSMASNALWRSVVLVAIMGAVVWGSGRTSNGMRRVGWVAVLGLLWIDGFTHTPHLVPTLPSSVYAPGLVNLEPRPTPGESRAMITPRAERLLMTRTLPDFLKDFLGSRLGLWANFNLIEGIPKVNGGATLRPRAEAEWEARLYASPTNDFPAWMDFLGVTQVSSSANPVEWTRRTGALPFVTCGQRPVFVDRATTLPSVFAADFRPAEVVYLPQEARPEVLATNAALARIISLSFHATRIVLEIEAASPAMVVLAQSYYPGWRASVNARPATLWRANHAFQALEVPAGRSRVEVVYRDRPFQMGIGFSLLTFGVCAVAWWRRRPGAAAGS